jgi:hypothetical protein
MNTGIKVRINKMSTGIIYKMCHGIFHRDMTKKNCEKDFGRATYSLFFGNLGLDEPGDPFYPVKI